MDKSKLGQGCIIRYMGLFKGYKRPLRTRASVDKTVFACGSFFVRWDKDLFVQVRCI